MSLAGLLPAQAVKGEGIHVSIRVLHGIGAALTREVINRPETGQGTYRGK